MFKLGSKYCPLKYECKILQGIIFIISSINEEMRVEMEYVCG